MSGFASEILLLFAAIFFLAALLTDLILLPCLVLGFGRGED